MHRDGIEKAVSIGRPSLSSFSVKSYNGRAHEKAQQLGGPEIYSVESWYDEPKFIRYWSEQINQTMANVPEQERERTVVIFSEQFAGKNFARRGTDPDQLKETADLIANEANMSITLSVGKVKVKHRSRGLDPTYKT